MFELYTPLFLASFDSVDCLKGKPLGTVLFSFKWQIHWHKLRDCGLSRLRVIVLCSRHSGKADLSAYAFSVLICLYLRAGLIFKVEQCSVGIRFYMCPGRCCFCSSC